MPFRDESGIYQIICTSNNNVYIGSAVNLRIRRTHHFTELRHNNHDNRHLQNAFNKYGENAFEWSILETCYFEDCLKIEQIYLDFIFNPDLFDQNLRFNICPIAGNSLGVKHSDEFKKKVSESHKGIKATEETRKRMSESRKGKLLSEDLKLKLSQIATENKGKSVKQLNKVTGEVISEYRSLREAEKLAGVNCYNISAVCNKKNGLKSAGGFGWCFSE